MKVEQMAPRALVVLMVLLFISGTAGAEADNRRGYPLEKRVAELEKEVAGLRTEMSAYRILPLPESLALCDKPIPLHNDDVREKFEREIFQFLENKGLLTIVIKRYTKFLAVVSEELTRANMPPDLIYLAISESYLNPKAVSKADARGFWQFIKDTAKREGLSVGDTIDERFSVKRSTKSALSYLKKLNSEFGDWFLAMAAYNCGEGRVREAISNQNTKDFFELFLPEETERYIYRVAALKEIVSNAKKYGLSIEKRQFYKPYSIWEATIEVRKDVHTLTLAQAMDLPYKAFREYNLHIRRYTLPKGIYYLYVPVEKKEIFLKRIKTCPGVSVEKNGNEPAKDNGS